LTFTPTDGTLTLTVTGSVTEAQLEAGSVATRYQWANTVADYDTVGFNKYLKFDGVDDGMSTAAVNFTATDKMTVFAGVIKQNNNICIITELSSNTGSSNLGSFVLHTHGGYRWAVYGIGGLGTDDTASIPNPSSTVITATCDFAGATAADELSVRVNAVTIAQSISGSANTGNFGNYPLFIGSRNNSTYFFSGNIYSLIIRGALSSDAQIINAETYVNSKTGAY
jgi:hypothetical protein